MFSVALCNLGCSKNQIDGSQILEHLRLAGFEVTEDFASAHIIVVNTCAFIEAAKIEAIDKILALAKYKTSGRCKYLIVAGCFSERYRLSASRQIPEVDLWAGISDWPKLLAQHFKVSQTPSFFRMLQQPLATQYLKIADGCSHSCSFCAIPGIRGKYKSRPLDHILKEAQWLFEQGAKECILVSQDTSYYGRDCSCSLTSLLEAFLKHTSFPWIRLMYLHPSLVDEDLLRLVASEPRICKYFDIPLQHGSDTILKAMNRRPLSKGLYKLLDSIRTLVPDAAIRTSLITGFPGENERLFEEMVSFIQKVRFDKVGVFSFSPEEGTAAFSMKPAPRPATSLRRSETLMSLQREISESINASKIGRIVEVIIDGPGSPPDNRDFCWEGRTQWDAPEVDGNVYIKGSGLKPGDIIKVSIKNATDYDLFGEYTHRNPPIR